MRQKKKYFDHKKSEVEYEFQKKKYRVKKLEVAHLSKMNNTHTLRELAIAGKDIVRPIKQGNAIGTAAVPAKIFLKKLIRKTRLGRLAVKTKDVGSKAAEAAKETGSVSEAIYASGTRFASEAIKSAGHAALNIIGDKHAQNKYLKQVKQAEKKANKYLEKKTENLKKAEAAVKSENAPKELTKEIEKFKDKETSKKMRSKLASKNQKLAFKNKKLDKKIEKQTKKLAKAQKKVKAPKKVAKASKFFKGVLAIGGSSFIFPIIIILIALIILASVFSWLSPFEFEFAGIDTGESKKITAETDDEIIEGYVLMVQNYLDIAQLQYYLVYGAYADAVYVWENADLPWSDFYASYVEPKIEEAVKEITERYNRLIAEAETSAEKNRLSAEMNAEIERTTNQILMDCTELYNETLESLNDYLENGILNLYIPGENQTVSLSLKGGKDDEWDAGQYSYWPCEGTNKFDLQSVEMQTDMTVEDIFALIALSRTITVWQNDNESVSDDDNTNLDGDETKNLFSPITPQDINEFFQKTEFVEITSKREQGECCGLCSRKLVGSWDEGWHWEYFCGQEHQILTGEIKVKSKEEMFEAVLEKYNADESGMTKEDCESAIEDYMNLFEETFGENYDKHLFGANDNSRAVEMYNALGEQKTITNNVWLVDTPLDSETETED